MIRCNIHCRRICCFMLAVVVSALGSCSKKDSAARRGGTLIVGEISNFQSLNPMGTTDAHARDIYKLLFLTLMDEQADFITFKPRLAESYEFSDDRKRLTFHIRRDVVWSDGLPVTAHDVAATFRAQKNPDVAWSGRHLKEHIDSVEVIDEWTVTYHFNRVYLYQLMDANDGPILPKHALDKVPPEKIRQIPAEELPTNGPFRIEEWVKGQALTLVPYSGYYEEGKPYLDKVIYKIIPDRVTLMTQLRSGEIDCMESIPLGEVDNLRKSNPELRILDYPSRNYTYIAWNGAHPFFGNPRVRRALTMAIDRKLIIDNIYYGYAEECTSPFVPLIWAYNPDIEPIPYDPERAAEILAEEEFSDTDSDGWLDRDGRRFEFEIMTNYGNQIRSDIQVMVQEMLRKIGIKVNPVILEWTVFMDHLTSSNFEATVSALRIGTKADLSPIWSCESRRKGGYNRVDYCNRVVDSLNAEASSMLDLDKARPLFFKAQEIIYNEQPFTFICRPRPLGALNRRFKDAKPDAIGMYHNLQDWWVLRDE